MSSCKIIYLRNIFLKCSYITNFFFFLLLICRSPVTHGVYLHSKIQNCGQLVSGVLLANIQLFIISYFNCFKMLYIYLIVWSINFFVIYFGGCLGLLLKYFFDFYLFEKVKRFKNVWKLKKNFWKLLFAKKKNKVFQKSWNCIFCDFYTLKGKKHSKVKKFYPTFFKTNF